LFRARSNAVFRKELSRWFKVHRRALPWRKTEDPYKIWVSEVMLQQTTAPAVIPYYEKWIKLFPDMKTLASASLQTVLKAWEGLGYYERARNLHRAARIMCRQNDGRVPASYEALIALPGFGPYITAAVLSIAYSQPFPVLDANVRRVMMRLAGLHGQFNARLDKVLLQKTRSVFPERGGGDFNQAMMELGALVCRPGNPACLLCPVQSFCRAFERGEQEVIPTPRKRNIRDIETVVGIIRKRGRYLIQQRPPHGLMAGLWEFPGGKREKGETLRGALRRELREELGTEVKVNRRLLKVRHYYTRFRVTLSAFDCDLPAGRRLEKRNARWVSLKGLKRYPFPSGNAKIVRFLENSESRREHGRSTGE
jgi:A/G-specific adenine glycosylase